VKGPAPSNVAARFAFTTADSSKPRFAPATTCDVMVPGAGGLLSSSLSQEVIVTAITEKNSTDITFLSFIDLVLVF
jgi:hypothetical protein